MADRSYAAVMGRRGEILQRAVGLEYGGFARDRLAFDF